MKHLKTISIILFSIAISLYSCKDKETQEAPKQDTKQPLQVFDSPNQQSATTQSSGSAWHYTCANGCAGGAAAAGNCSTCGNVLVHNQAYHNNTNNTTTTTTTPTVTSPTNPTAATNPEPSQNAAGVWHYTCANGCAGGAGAASKCGSCGSTLAHNTAYHQ